MTRFYRVLSMCIRYGAPLMLLVVFSAMHSKSLPAQAAGIDNGLYYTSDAGRFDVMFPVPISLHEQKLTYSLDLHPYQQLSGSSLDCHQLAAKDYGAVWMVIYCDYPPEALADLTADQILDDARESAFFVDRAPRFIDEAEITAENGAPGRIFHYELPSNQDVQVMDTYTARAYLDGSRLYWIGAWVTSENQGYRLSLIDPFLDSFFIETTPLA